MKTYLKIVIGAVLIGGILAFFFYKDIKNEVVALTTSENKVYVFQVGVFKSLENAQTFSKKFPSSGIYKDEDIYRVIIAATLNNKEKLEFMYNELGINYYLKEVVVDNEILEKIRNYDRVIAESDNNDVINKLNKSCVELFLENQT